MATYILLSRFTQQGLQTIKDGPPRLDAAKETLRGLGAELKDFYLVSWSARANRGVGLVQRPPPHRREPGEGEGQEEFGRGFGDCSRRERLIMERITQIL